MFYNFSGQARLRMRDPLPLPLDSRYHMFCFLIIKQSRVCKIILRFDLQKFPMLPLTEIGILAIPGLFSYWFISVVGRCKNATETYDFLKFLLFFDVYIVI